MWTGGRRPGRLRRAASAADMEKLSALQEQKGELRKRLSYTTHKLEKLETEFDSTRHYLEIELRRAQEELDKVTEKLRRIQSNYMALQRTVSPYPAEPYRYPASPGPQQALMPPNLWSLRAKPSGNRLAGEDIRGQWRPVSVEDVGAYSYQAGAAAGRAASPCNYSERYYGGGGGGGAAGGGSPGDKAEGRASPLYATYKADSFSEGDDLSQGHLAEPCFLRAGGDLSLSPSRSADALAGYAASDGDGDRLRVQLCGAGSSPEPEHGSRESLEPSSMEASPEMHPPTRLSPQQAFPRTGGSGLSRKDSLTKAQLYGTLLN